MLLSTLEAYDLVRFAEAFDARLAAAEELLASRSGMEHEKGWMATALELVRTAREPAPAMLDRVRDLPELEEVREEYALAQQNVWVDALEKLHAGITFCAGSRAPVIEALFPHLKFPQLRRAPRDAVNEYVTGYERRLKSSYVARILTRDDFGFVRPVVDQVAGAYAAWITCFKPIQLSDEQAAPLRRELIGLGKRLDIAVRQARLLSEAALVPIPDAFEAAGLAARPRKRSGRAGAPLFEGTDSALFDDAASFEPEAEVPAPEAAAEPALPEVPEAVAPEDAAPEPTAPELTPEKAPAKPGRRGRKKASARPSRSDEG